MRQEFQRGQGDPQLEEQALRRQNARPGKKYRKPLLLPEGRKIPTAIIGGVNNRIKRSKAKITLATHA